MRIALYDENHIEIFNPGGFPGLIDINNLGDGTSYPRNPTLARLARKLGLAEKLGRGLRLIFDKCKEQRIKKPTYSEEGDNIKLTLYFGIEPNEINNNPEGLLQLFGINAAITIKDIMHHLKVSLNTATRYANILIRAKKIKRIGEGPATRFILC